MNILCYKNRLNKKLPLLASSFYLVRELHLFTRVDVAQRLCLCGKLYRWHGLIGMWRLGEQAEEAFSSAWNNKMIVFSAKLIDHTPHRAICLLKGHPGPGKVERRQQRTVVTTRPGQPTLWGYVIDRRWHEGAERPTGFCNCAEMGGFAFPGKLGLDPTPAILSFLWTL